MNTSLIHAADGAVTGFASSLPLSTTDELDGFRVVRTLGLVRGNAVRARHVGHDIVASLRNLVGGEVREYTKLLAEAREQAIDRMAEQARSQGGDAVVGVRFTTSMVMGGAAELLAYGTAVQVVPRE
ncbi:MAG: YbjQ family protein [Myxococcota bacterium]